MTTTIALECDASIARDLSTELQALADGEIASAEKNHLDGSVPTVLQILQVASPLVAALAPVIIAHLKRIKRIKIGDVELENPTEADLRRVLAKYSAK
jgi:hypothetical protein